MIKLVHKLLDITYKLFMIIPLTLKYDTHDPHNKRFIMKTLLRASYLAIAALTASTQLAADVIVQKSICIQVTTPLLSVSIQGTLPAEKVDTAKLNAAIVAFFSQLCIALGTIETAKVNYQDTPEQIEAYSAFVGETLAKCTSSTIETPTGTENDTRNPYALDLFCAYKILSFLFIIQHPEYYKPEFYTSIANVYTAFEAFDTFITEKMLTHITKTYGMSTQEIDEAIIAGSTSPFWVGTTLPQDCTTEDSSEIEGEGCKDGVCSLNLPAKDAAQAPVVAQEVAPAEVEVAK